MSTDTPSTWLWDLDAIRERANRATVGSKVHDHLASAADVPALLDALNACRAELVEARAQVAEANALLADVDGDPTALAVLYDQTRAEVERLRAAGRCFHTVSGLFGVQLTCTLTAGHEGGHSDGESHWGPAPLHVEPDPPETVYPLGVRVRVVEGLPPGRALFVSGPHGFNPDGSPIVSAVAADFDPPETTP